ncbi:AMP-dependent synthetase [Bdellovibrio bacteriovorus]|uniref:AMP-dependent synthetase n=1 Tax=Bdellovibrio bacteriovorus TaxID=959 RepID=A0A150WRK5_BDEBC|nr:AMP-binding protein [Bdellovibrio bacteriovorus]KYG67141.1 AMP-dependent synthetase [Bdellovibrio bacteriovorus]
MSFRGEFEQARDFLILHRSDYDYAYNHFKWPQLEEFNWALDYFDPMASLNSHLALWIVDENGVEQKATFEEMSLRSNQVANFLRKQGLKKGDSILILLENEMSLWEIMLGAMKIGAVLVPASPLLSHQELRDRLERESIKAIATNKKHSQKFGLDQSAIIPLLVDAHAGESEDKWIPYSEVRNERTSFVHSDAEKTKGSDPLFRYFVSANTVKPKIIEHTHVSYPVGHLSTMFWMGVHPGDIHLGISSSGWSMHDWNNFLVPWNAEATIFIYKQERFNAHKLLEAMAKYKVTTFCAPPTVWRLLAQENLKDYKMSLREALSTGETLNAETISMVHKSWNLFIRDGYGQTEMPMVIGVSPSEKNSFGTMGKALPGFRVRLLNNDAKDSDAGEICVDIEESPLKFIAGASEGIESYHTGDFAYMDYAGNYTFSQRADGLFKSSDYRVSPFEIEAVLSEFPAVREAVVIPSSDPIRDFVPKALVSVIKGTEPTRELALDIMSFTRQRLAPFKRVRRIEFVEIPKNTAGEIPRAELVALERVKRSTGEKGTYEFWEEDAKISLAETWAQELP